MVDQKSMRVSAFLALGLTLGLFGLHDTAFAAATVLAEKNCSLKLEGEEFEKGAKVNLFREEGGKKRRLAIAEIIRVQPGGKAVAKVIKGQKQCGSLKGASAELSGSSSSSGTASKTESSGDAPKGKLPKLDASFLVGGLRLGSANIHKDGEPIDALVFTGIGIGADFYPLMFAGNGLLHRMVGIGFSYKMGIASDIEITDNTEPAAVALADRYRLFQAEAEAPPAGKLKLAPTDIDFALIARYAYMNDALSTEGRIGFLSHALEGKITAGEAPSPLYSTKFSGPVIGVMQRWNPIPVLRINIGGAYRILSGTLAVEKPVEATGAEQTFELDVQKKSGSGFGMELSGDFIYKIFKVTGGLQMSTFNAVIETGKEDSPTAAFSESYTFFYLGLGVLM